MSYIGEAIFSDAVKDVIGNDPVVDQFDIDYDASFFGTMQDDYVTGTILVRTTSVVNNKKVVTLSTGSRPRGKAFSKYFAESQPALDSTYGSGIVRQNPSLAYRQVPWHERVSHTSYKVTQHIDSSERYFDSCLPNIVDCFKANGASPWTIAKSIYESAETKSWLSPYRNVDTNGIAHIIFNGYESETVTDNRWTWSYPYENRYNPNFRSVSVDKALGLGKIDMQVDASIDFKTLNVTQGDVKKTIAAAGFVPLLPGKSKVNELDRYARNSFRSVYVSSGAAGTKEAATTLHSSVQYDDEYGYCYTIPTDVNLNQLVDHISLLSPYPNVTNPGSEYLTGAMSPDDTVRFLFGFGDVNNMTYGYRQFLPSLATASYTEAFDDMSTALAANAIGTAGVTYNTSDLKLSWAASPSVNPWWVDQSYGTYVDTTNYFSGGVDQQYFYISGSTGGGKGLYWLSSSSPSNTKVLRSNTNYLSYSGSMTDPAPPGFVTSSCCVDVTSSYPWYLRYKRAIAAHNTEKLAVYFSGIPGIPSGEYDATSRGLGVIRTIEVLTGSGTGVTAAPSAESTALMTQYDSRVQGIGADQSTGTPATATHPFDPGAYRIVFTYRMSGGSTTIGNPSLAAIDDLQVLQLKDDAFPPDEEAKKLGCNNYPQFRTYRSDPRFNPIAEGYATQVSGTADFYKGHNFGISPIVRGWKYGLYSGFPTYSKAIFRRNRFGQMRDMLEQRQYTKFVLVKSSYFDDRAVSRGDYNKDDTGNSLAGTAAASMGSAAVDVKFSRQAVKIDNKGIGYIYLESVPASGTVSMNLSTEVTSSQPYFDDEVRLRDFKLDASYGSIVKVADYP